MKNILPLNYGEKIQHLINLAYLGFAKYHDEIDYIKNIYKAASFVIKNIYSF
jgi:hypothetical protein